MSFIKLLAVIATLLFSTAYGNEKAPPKHFNDLETAFKFPHRGTDIQSISYQFCDRYQHPEGKVREKCQDEHRFYFDKQGYETERRKIDSKGTVIETTLITSIDDQQEHRTIDSAGALIKKSLLTRDPNSRLITEVKHFSNTGQLQSIERMTYSETGKLLVKLYLGKDEQLLRKVVHEYNQKDQKIRTEISYHTSEQPSTYGHVYFYDDKGLFIATAQTGKGKFIPSDKVSYKYHFDSRDNWVQQDEYYRGNFGRINYRKITYYK